MSTKLSEAYEDYLQAILRFCADREDCIVKTSELAEYLNVKPPSVTEMLDKLKSKGYIEYQKRKGVKLTKKGRDVAERVLQSHRIIELFLRDVLQIKDPHELASKLEHHITREMREAIENFMRNPRIEASTLSYFNLDRVRELFEEFTGNILKCVSNPSEKEAIIREKDNFLQKLGSKN
ncbi:MAG: metal-dependent transcriptional regulator [Candidatus Helarchaeales archaeon]